MKKLLLYSLFAFAILLSPGVMAQQGIGTNQPDRSSAVDIVSTKRGLLIPRLELSATDNASPVTNPANSLLVYNTETAGVGDTAVTPGFYYWDEDAGVDGEWVRFVDAGSEKTVIVEDGENITVEEEVDGNETTYTVSVKGGATDQMVLVTKYVNGVDDTDGTTTEWIDYTELIDAENGLNYDPETGLMKLGGDLTENTTIDVGEYTFTIAVDPTEGGSIVIDGLEEMDEADWEDARVVVMKPDGTLETVNLQDILDELEVTADNGLTMTDNNIQLGGDLTKPTVIATGESAADVDNQDSGNTLAITGLEDADAANEIVVAETAGGVLRTVKRSISTTTSGALSVDGIADYSAYVQEINISATLAAADYAITLPAASAENRGQVVNIKIANTTEAHDGFLDIDVTGGGTLTYGTMPYQAWVVKSDGTNWVIVGRN